MDASECNLKPERRNSEYFQELDDDDGDDEALSLCDLPLNSETASVCDEFSMQDQISSFDQDLFEFFSENFTSSSAYTRDNIIFCGKLIPCKCEDVDDEKAQNSDNTSKAKKNYSFSKLRSSSWNIMERENSFKTWKTSQEPSPGKKCVDKHDFPMKSRGYMFALVGRYPVEMELNGIKTRQRKLSEGKMRRSVKIPEKKTSRSDDHRRKKSWWGLVDILGCKSYNPNAMVRDSLTCIPRV